MNLDLDLAGRVVLSGPGVKEPRDIHCWKQAMRPIWNLYSIYFNAAAEKELTQFFGPIHVQRYHPYYLRWCVFV